MELGVRLSLLFKECHQILQTTCTPFCSAEDFVGHIPFPYTPVQLVEVTNLDRLAEGWSPSHPLETQYRNKLLQRSGFLETIPGSGNPRVPG